MAGSVNETSVRPVPPVEMFCTIMSMLISAVGELTEDRGGLARLVGNADDGDLDLAAVVRDAADDRVFHGQILHVAGDDGAGLVRERRADVDRDAVPAAVLDAAQMQDLGAAGRELEHLLVRDGVQAPGVRHDARVGGEHTVDVGVDLADVGVERGGERDRRGVRAAPAERRDVLRVRADALEAGDDRDVARGDRVLDAAGRDVHDPRLAVHRRGQHAGLRAGERLGLVAEGVDRHGEQRHRDALTGSEQHVELAPRRDGDDLLGEVDQLVGRVAHRRDDDDDVVAVAAGGDDAFGDPLDPLGVGDRRAAVLLYDETHRISFRSTRTAPSGYRPRLNVECR